VKLAAVDVQVCTADPCTAGFHQHLVRPDAWIGRLAHPYISIVIKDGCPHLHSTHFPFTDGTPVPHSLRCYISFLPFHVHIIHYTARPEPLTLAKKIEFHSVMRFMTAPLPHAG